MIRQLDVDGVPTLLAPTSGPLRAGLTFRVGTADETLPRRGITHLLEHLALAPLGLADYHFNGATASTYTSFYMQGSEEDVAGFLTAVCRTIHDLPMGRLEVEKEILRTEWSSRGSAPVREIPFWRHGARDHGLISFAEFGLPTLTEHDLRQWAARWFTPENAVLWIAGDRVPAGLRLALPAGVRQPVPAASSALPTTPAYFANGSRAVVLDSVVRRRSTASVLADVLERELFRSLRQEDGLSYAIDTSYQPRGDGYATLRALADALPEKQDAVLGGFIDVLAKLRVGRIEQADLEAAVAKREDALASPEVDADRLPTCALNLLTGEPNLTVDELRAELNSVTLADLHQVVQEVTATALLMVPDGHTADWAGFTEAPTRSTHTVTGTAYQQREGDAELRVGVDGVSYLGPGGPHTVRYAECAAMLAWPDGARRLIGYDAISVHIEPTLFDLHPGAIHVIDQQVPADRRLPMPARPPEQIPQPYAAANRRQSQQRPAPAKRSWWEIPVMVLSGLATLGVGGISLLLTLSMFITDEADGDEGWLWGMVVVCWLVTVVLALPIVLLRRRRR
ncbi:Predicted Zn-dependent peptidase [Micromonospora rhizosphaerae]|uniref:Predicted Zn-dependent peptidase n=1 Tax=Micromonospora rhizosphaerae TaxID=568872 RepID=A0A1C6T9X5_9ACTN|nr:insulinase family protein [Micromonospora rhizosphaerae]SCL38323.1 Predicted Zn-dependent peptidase [Micromonospora rhizosphaerae]